MVVHKMPLIRTAIIHPGGRKQKTISHYTPFHKAKPAKIPRAKIKGVQVGHGNTGKETQHTVARRMADPNKPIQPNPHPKPKDPGITKAYHAGKIDRPTYRAKMKELDNPNHPHNQLQAQYHAGLRNDPNFHKLTAKVMNQERQTRQAESKMEHADSDWPKKSPVKKAAKMGAPRPRKGRRV